MDITKVIFLALSLAYQAVAAPVQARGCDGNNMIVQNPGQALKNVVDNYFIVENKQAAKLTDDLYVLKPSVQCPFKVTLSSPNSARSPSMVPQATCDNCSPKCKPIQIKKAFLHKHCDPQIGEVQKFVEESLVIGTNPRHWYTGDHLVGLLCDTGWWKSQGENPTSWRTNEIV